MKLDMPQLANYAPLPTYVPMYGDFVVWSGLFSTWFGVVCNWDDKTQQLGIIFDGLPLLLLTMAELDYSKNTRHVSLGKIRNSSPGTWAVFRHDQKHNAIVWFV